MSCFVIGSSNLRPMRRFVAYSVLVGFVTAYARSKRRRKRRRKKENRVAAVCLASERKVNHRRTLIGSATSAYLAFGGDADEALAILCECYDRRRRALALRVLDDTWFSALCMAKIHISNRSISMGVTQAPNGTRRASTMRPLLRRVPSYAFTGRPAYP
jgi:hypothetical protein